MQNLVRNKKKVPIVSADGLNFSSWDEKKKTSIMQDGKKEISQDRYRYHATDIQKWKKI